MTKKTLKDFLEVYKPKSPDEQKFVDKHVVIKHKDRNGNGDDVFKATNIKTVERKKERHGYDVGEDEKVYEELKGDQHKIDANKNGKVDAHDFKLLRKKKKVAEEVEELDESLEGGYKASSEKSKFDSGHRAKLINGAGKVSYVSAKSYKTPKHAKAAAAYYHSIRHHSISRMDDKMHDYNKAYDLIHGKVNEEVDVDSLLDEALNALLSIDEKTLTPAEMKKREEVVKAIKRGNPKMDKSMAYAIATKTAKRVAEGKIPTADEPDYDSEKTADKVRRMLAKEKKPVKEDVEDLDESVAKVAQHLIKRYGDNVRKSHVRSAANDFGVGFVALSHHVRKKLGVNRLEEEQIDELSVNTLDNYRTKARKEIIDADANDDTDTYNKRAKGYRAASKSVNKKLAKEEAEQIDELSFKKLAAYTSKSADSVSGAPVRKQDNRIKGQSLADKKIRKMDGYSSTAKVAATHEEVEQIDELSKKTLGNYTYKAASELGSKGITTGLKIAADEPTEKNFKKMANRQKGVATAVKKLTKEDIINRSIDKYVPEEVKFTPEERLLKRLDGLSEAHVNTLLGLFEALNKDNQNKMIETVETREGINQLLNFALENRGE